MQLLVDVEMLPVRNAAAYIALVHMACKTLESLRVLGGPRGTASQHRLVLKRQEMGQIASCNVVNWSDTHRVPCAEAARALAAMHRWCARHGDRVPLLSLMLDCRAVMRRTSSENPIDCL